jgi:signal transduction histidine kinase
MTSPLRVLILEDSPTDAEVMVRHLEEGGYAPQWWRAETEADFLAHLAPELDLILADYTLPEFTARRALELLREQGWDIPTIIVTGTVSEEIALACLRLGAADYLLKDRLTRLAEAVRSALAQQSLRRERVAAEAASRHKSEFLTNMSHELRTPLNSILGFSELLLEQTQQVLSPRQRRYLTHIHESGRHLLQLINDVLDLSKVEAGRLTLHPEPLPVALTVQDLLALAQGLANKKHQAIRADIAPDLPPLSMDLVRFKQILFNLLSNAVKFTPEGGTITVSVRRVAGEPLARASGTVGVPAGEWLELVISDTGIGIRAEDLPRLFQAFEQLEPAATKSHEGTGLGLVLTKRLVQLHGGRIRAESAGTGCGSTFTVLLPFAGPSAPTDAADQER